MINILVVVSLTFSSMHSDFPIEVEYIDFGWTLSYDFGIHYNPDIQSPWDVIFFGFHPASIEIFQAIL